MRDPGNWEDRRDENRRRSEDEGARVRRDLTDKIRASDVAALRARGEADRLGGEIGRRTSAAHVRAARDRMDRAHASLVGLLATAAELWQARSWSERLADLDLAAPSADAALTTLGDELADALRTATMIADGLTRPEPPLPRLPAGLAPIPVEAPDGVAAAPAEPDPRRDQVVRDARLQASTLRMLLATLESLGAAQRHYRMLAAR